MVKMFSYFEAYKGHKFIPFVLKDSVFFVVFFFGGGGDGG